MFFVYILYSKSTEQFYKGQTDDLVNRIFRHNNGYEKFTKKGIPWTILWSTIKDERSESLKLEKKLKNLGKEETLKFMLKYDEGIAGPDELLLIKQLSGC